MNEASSPKDLKSSNSPPGGGASNYDEFKKNLGIFPEDREDEKYYGISIEEIVQAYKDGRINLDGSFRTAERKMLHR